MKTNPNNPFYPEFWDHRHVPEFSLTPGITIRQIAVFDMTIALVNNNEWYAHNTREATVKEAIYLVDEVFKQLNEEK